MLPRHRPMLRARIMAATLVVAAASLGASAAEPGGPAQGAPVVISEVAPPAALRRLTPRGETSPAEPSGRSRLPSAGSALSALAVVLLLIFGGARLWKTHGPKLPTPAPRQAIEVLGRCRIESRQAVYLVRLGSRVLVLGSSGGELSALSDITDPVEVDLITAQCRDGSGGSSPFSRLFEARRKTGADSVGGNPAEPERRPVRWLRNPAEQRLAERVRGRATDEEASRVA